MKARAGLPLFATILIASLSAILPVAVQAQAGIDVPRAVQNAIDRQSERAQNQASDRVSQQAQNQAAEQAQAQQANAVQSQVAERVGNQVEHVQAQSAARVQAQVERAQDSAINHADKLPQQAAEIAREKAGKVAADVGNSAATQTGPVTNSQQPSAVQGVAATAKVVTAAVKRQPVMNRNGSQAFVEITLEPGVRAVEFEWMMLVSPAQHQQLNVEAPELMRFLTGGQAYGVTNGELLTFTVPADLDANDAILQLVPENLRGQIDRNHLYENQSKPMPTAASASRIAPSLSLPMNAVCKTPVAIGMIDSAVDWHHHAFSQLANTHSRIKSRSFVAATLLQPAGHGTAVAAMLVGRKEGKGVSDTLHPLLPNATIYAAAVFHANEGEQQSATLLRILNALDWLNSQNDVHVINMSMAGPANRLLAQAVAATRKHGKMIVAAVGNEGPFGPALYPAAYDGVIGVTAVDQERSVFRWAAQGPQVDFAALGVSVPTARVEGGIAPQSGTSIAAPVVAAFLACALADHKNPMQALQSLEARAIDLGQPGPDPVYGKGLLHP